MAQRHLFWDELPVLGDNKLPQRFFYNLQDAADIIGCRPSDVLHYGFMGLIEIVASAQALGIACVARDVDDDFEPSEKQGDIYPSDMRPDELDFFVIDFNAALDLELTGKATMSHAHYGYEAKGYPWLNIYTHRERFDQHKGYSFFDLSQDWELSSETIDVSITLNEIYITIFTIERFKRGEAEYSFRGGKNHSIQRHTKPERRSHGNAERHAATRESVLMAALYCKKAWPEQCGTTNRDWARLIDEKSPLFWPESGKPPLSLDVIERLLGNAQKLPGDVK